MLVCDIAFHAQRFPVMSLGRRSKLSEAGTSSKVSVSVQKMLVLSAKISVLASQQCPTILLPRHGTHLTAFKT